MHTAICAFDERAKAQHAVDRLARAGFARQDIHLEHKRVSGEGQVGDHRAVPSHEAPGRRGALSGLGHFFTSLLGRDNPSGHVDTYSDHVERGGYVVVVDARDESEAHRALGLLKELQGNDAHVVHRPEQQPLRELVGTGDGVAGMVERSRETYEGDSSAASIAGERVMASHRLDTMAGADLRSPDLEHAPGLRYADKDKPNG